MIITKHVRISIYVKECAPQLAREKVLSDAILYYTDLARGKPSAFPETVDPAPPRSRQGD